MSQTLVHATCVALAPAAAAKCAAAETLAVLLRGPSGAGKSDLALRLIDRGGALVADDQTCVKLKDGRLLAAAPPPIAGRMEVRGLGIADVPRLADVPLALVVDLVPGAEIERLPESERCEILGVSLPRIRLDPFEPSAPAKLRLALGARTEPPAAAPDVPDPGTAETEAGRTLILVTGMSGAGRSTALSILEDLGYESIDNLPLKLLKPLLDGSRRPIALGIDIRTRGFAGRPILDQLAGGLRRPGLDVSLLFLDCDDEVLGRRYTETRRRHPLARGRAVADGIAAERDLISPLKQRADHVVDTSALSPGELRRILAGHYAPQGAGVLTVCVTSFSYRNGLPRDADLVFDVRFLRNPHYDPELRALTGRDARVAGYVAADGRFAAFFAQLTEFLRPLLPGYRREGKTYLTIAIGCTGGRHRSVAVAERLAGWLAEAGEQVNLLHRDLGEETPGGRDGA